MATTLQEVRDKIESEGFNYGFRFYSTFEEVEDVEFHKLRVAYVEAAEALEGYLEDNTVGEDEEAEEEDEDGA